METAYSTVILWLVPGMFMVCFSGLAYVLLQALKSGAEAYSGEYTEQTARQFEDIFLFIPPRRIKELAWVAAAALFIFMFMATGSLNAPGGLARGAVLGVTAGVLGLYAPRWTLAFLKKKRRQRFDLQLVDSLVSMSNGLKAGFSIMQVFEAVVKEGQNPIAQEFALLLQQTRLGVKFEDALRNMEQRVGSEDFTLVTLAIETARQTGGNLTEVFERIAQTIRERMRIQRRIRTLTAQGRLQGIVVGVIPAVLALLMTLIDPRMMMPFLQSGPGFGVLIAVVLLEVMGALIIRNIIRIDI